MNRENSSEALVIPDQVLEANTCRLCRKYLSVTPISVHPQGGNICGRCTPPRAPKSKSLFECNSLADLSSIPYAIFAYANHLFPCINRYEGCAKLLAFNEISSHESTCPVKTTKCRLCGYEGRGSQQIIHFKTAHRLNFIDKVRFRIPLHGRFRANLIKRGQQLFFLYVNVHGTRVDFWVSPTGIMLDDDIDFFCLLKDVGDGEVIDQTTVSRRSSGGIYHSVFVRNRDVCFDDHSRVFCECLLRRVSTAFLKATSTRSSHKLRPID